LKPDKKKQDYIDFINARFKVVCDLLAKWGFIFGEQEYEEITNDLDE